MTKFKYENRGGSGFRTYHPFANINHDKRKKEVVPTKTELLLKKIRKGSELKNSQWNYEDLSYKEIKLGYAIKILLKIVYSNSEIIPMLKKMKKNRLFYSKVRDKIKSNYKNISTSALKITLEENKDIYR